MGDVIDLFKLTGAKTPSTDRGGPIEGILEAIDMDSYRVEKRSTMKIRLTDEDQEIDPVPISGGAQKGEPELDLF